MSAPRLSPPRLNPFAIPSGTLLRFAMLIVAASAAALGALSQDAARALGVRQADVIAYQVCVQEEIGTEVARRQARGDPAPDGTVPGEGESGMPFESILTCHDPRDAVGVWPNLLAIGFFWLLVLALYWVLPRWRIRHRRLRPLDPDRPPELAAYLRELQREAGVRDHVTYLLAPLNPKVSGLAFGRVGRRCVMLSGGLVALFARDRAAFRTVVLHELAHIRNRDLDITFITILVWRVVAVLLVRRFVAGVANVGLGAFPGYGIATEVASTVQTVLLAAVVPLARNAVLRSRELYADARTAQWDSSPEQLRHLFDTYSHPQGESGGPLRTHPRLADRRAALADPQALVTIGFLELLGVGVMVSLGLDVVAEFLAHPNNLPNDLIGVLVAAPLLAGGVGLAVWRETLRSVLTRAPPRLGPAGWGLGAGLAAGTVITPTSAFNFYGTGVSPLGIVVPGLVVLVVTGPLLLRWVGLVTRCWLPVVAARDRPTPAILGTLLAMTVPVALGLNFVTLLPQMALYARAVEFPQLSGPVVFLIAAGVLILGQPHTLVLPLLSTLALLPVLGAEWSGRVRHRATPRAFTLDPHLPGPPTGWLPPIPPSGLRTAIRVGLVCAAVGAALVLAGQSVLSTGARVLALPVLVVAAVITGLRVPALRAAHAVVAAAVTGVVLVPFTGPAVAGWGVLLAAVAGGAVAVVARSRRSAPRQDPPRV